MSSREGPATGLRKEERSPTADEVQIDGVHLVTKSGTDRLLELTERRESYERLLHQLDELPKKIRHKGIIPLGPRLYARGSLVRTNELLVLLGSSYFAERSAYQTSEIVRRRLAIIDQNIEQVEVGRSEAKRAIRGEKASLQERQSEEKDNVVARVLKGYDETKDAQKGKPLEIGADKDKTERFGQKTVPKKAAPINAKHPWTAFDYAAALNISTETPSTKAIDTASSSQTARSSLAMRSPTNSSGRKPPRPSSSPSGGKRVTFAPGTKSTDGDDCEQPTSTANVANEMISNLQESVAVAERATAEAGIAHITEEYDRSGKLVGVEGVDSNNDENDVDIDALYDITKPKEASRRGSVTREELMNELLKAEREAEAEENRRAARESIREAQSFGTGFAKGFFGKSKQNDNGTKRKDTMDRVEKEDIPAPTEIDRKVEQAPSASFQTGTKAEDYALPADSVGNIAESFAVEKHVFERGSGSRRRRNRPAPILSPPQQQPLSVKSNAALSTLETEDADDNDNTDIVPGQRVSRFRQMRAKQKS